MSGIYSSDDTLYKELRVHIENELQISIYNYTETSTLLRRPALMQQQIKLMKIDRIIFLLRIIGRMKTHLPT